MNTTMERYTQGGAQIALALLLILILGMYAPLRGAHAAAPIHRVFHDTSSTTMPHISRTHYATTVLTTCDETIVRTAITNAATGDTIQFNMSSPCTITLTAAAGGRLVISKDLTLDASGSPQPVTLSGGDATPVLLVNSGITFILKALIIAHGYVFTGGPGGGIYNDGTVSITNSTITTNSAFSGGGIYNDGTVSITNSTIANNTTSHGEGGGGGIYNDGTVSITNSTIANNTTSSGGAGGGILNYGTVSITNSTIATNTAFIGGGIYNDGPARITNSTIANNTASFSGGGIYNDGAGTAHITNSTIATNTASKEGGGIYNDGVATITNSTIANNTASLDGGGISSKVETTMVAQSIVTNNPGVNCSGSSPTDQGYNLDSGTSCGFTVDTDLQNTDPKLDPASLGNNGGPTQTIALASDSPAINRIPPASCLVLTDQRGIPRPQGLTCDMGAFELVSSGPTLHLPATITEDATGVQGAVVTYTVTVTDPIYSSDQLTIVCTPASGSTFSIGVTTVHCSTSNPSRHTTSGSFRVTVLTPTSTPILPGLTLSLSHSGGNHFRVGDMITYRLDVLAREGTALITMPNAIQVTIVIPLGLDHLQAAGRGWHITLTCTSGPTLLTALYQGVYPIASGEHLPSLLVWGHARQAIPILTLAAALSVPGEKHPLLTAAYDTVLVAPPTQWQSPYQNRRHSRHQRRQRKYFGFSCPNGCLRKESLPWSP